MEQKNDISINNDQIVCYKVKGTYRINSLFNFILDHQASLNCNMTIKKLEEERQVIYCAIAQKQTQDIFPGFKLNTERSHLSIDKLIASEHNPRSREFSPAHATLVYENKAQQMQYRIHVFYNGRGQIINITAKSYPLSQLPLQNGVVVKLSKAQESSIKEETSEYHEQLQTLLNKKDEVYCELYQKSFQLNNQLASAVASGKKHIIIAKAQELKAIAHKLSAYNDTSVDGRIQFINRYLEKIYTTEAENINLSSQSSVVKKITPEPEDKINTDAEPKSKKAPKKISKKEQTLVELKNEIISLVNQMRNHQEQGLSDTYLMLWQELDFKVLTLELCSEIEETQFISEQRKKLSLKTKMLDYYAQCIEKGKLAEVKKIQPIVEQTNNTYPLYYELFIQLEDNQSVQRCTKDWVDMADFFFENSVIFKQVYTMKNMLLSYSSETQIGYGFLLKLYINNNLPAFSLFLKHCSQSLGAALIYKNQSYGFIHALIAASSFNTNPAFIKLALEQGMILNPIKSSYMASAQEARKYLSKSNRQLASGPSREHSFDQESHFISSHATVFAMHSSKIQKHPKIIRTLFPYASIEHLAIGIGRIVNSKEIYTRHLINYARPIVRGFTSKAECDKVTFEADGDNLALFFYPSEHEPDFIPVMKFCTELLDELKHKINQLEFNDEAKRALLHKFVQEGKNEVYHQSENDKAAAYLSAAQIIYVHISVKTAIDDEAMLESMRLISKMLPAERKEAFNSKIEALSEYMQEKRLLNEVQNKIVAEIQSNVQTTPLEVQNKILAVIQSHPKIKPLIGDNTFVFFQPCGEKEKPNAQGGLAPSP